MLSKVQKNSKYSEKEKFDQQYTSSFYNFKRQNTNWRNTFRAKGGSYDEKMRKSHLGWLVHVQKVAINTLVRMSDLIHVKRMKTGIGRPKMVMLEVGKKKEVHVN